MSVVEELKTVEQWEGFFDGFGANLAPMVYDSGENLTFSAADPHVHSEQTAWARQMQTGIYTPVDGRVIYRHRHPDHRFAYEGYWGERARQSAS